MDVIHLPILYLILVSAAHACGDLDSIKMNIKNGARDENLIASFCRSQFKRFYDCMCPSPWTQCIAELDNPIRGEQKVSQVSGTGINTRSDTHHAHARRFNCFHNATSEIIICSLVFDDDNNDDNENNRNVSRRAIEWFHMVRNNCSCVGIQWMHSRETILSKNDKTSLRPSQNCNRNLPRRWKFTAKSSTTVTSLRRKTAVIWKDKNAQDDNLWIIIITVIVVLSVIILVLLFVVIKRRCSIKMCSTTCKQEKTITNEITSDSVSYTIIGQAVSTTDNKTLGVTKVMNLNINATETCQKSGVTVQRKTNKLCDGTDLCYVEINHTDQSNLCDGAELGYCEINDIDQNIQREDNYDVIDDYENDHKQNLKVEGLAALKCPGVTNVKCNEDNERRGGYGEDDVYEGYNDDACKGRFPDVTDGPEIKNIVEEEILYSSVNENCAVKYSSIIFEENASDINTSPVDMGDDSARNNQHNNYEDMSMEISQKSEHAQNEEDISHGDAKSEEDYNFGKLSNTPGIGDNVASAPVYSRLRNESCERTHTYNVLCESNVE